MDGYTLTLVDPSTEEPFAEVRLAGTAEVDAAVAAARAALPGWFSADRGAMLRRVREAIEQRRAEFAGPQLGADLHRVDAAARPPRSARRGLEIKAIQLPA